MYSKDDIKIRLPLETDVVAVVSCNMSTCQTSQRVNLTFNNSKGWKKDDAICVHMRMEGNSTFWIQDGCELEHINDTVIVCNCSQMSTFTVLARIKSFENTTKMMESFHSDLEKHEGKDNTEYLKNLTDNLRKIESVSLLMAADALRQGQVKMLSDTLEVTVQASHINDITEEAANLLSGTIFATMDWAAIKGNQTSGIVCIATIVLKGPASGMDVGLLAKKDEKDATPKLVSDVLAISISSQETGNLSSPVIISFNLSEAVQPNKSALCVYWKSTDNGSGWLTDGCMVTHQFKRRVACSCTHLTSFAVLLAPRAIPEAHEDTLQMITYIGMAVSLVSLLLSLIAFAFCRSIKNIRITIHTHLCLSLLLAEALFMVDIDRSAHRITCTVIAILLHYLFLACFTWMLLEGVQLYLMVVKVFHSRSLRPKYLYLCGYGSPLVIVSVTVAVKFESYGTQKYCWLSLESGVIWAFLGPVCAIVGINAWFFFITVWKLIGKFSMLSTDVPHFKKVRSFTCTAIAQLVILGGTWVFGILYFMDGSIYLSYIFTAVNSLQGLFIFVLHCLLNKQVRSEFLKAVSMIPKTTCQTRPWNELQRSEGMQRSEATTNTYS
ncbi:putative adhesion G protein-coupled receptor E4P [Cetorhinus maximus]